MTTVPSLTSLSSRRALHWFEDYLTLIGSGRTGRMWQCPAHPDGSPSLSVGLGDTGAVLINDFGGCSYDTVLTSLGLERRHLFVPPAVTPAVWAMAALENWPQFPPVEFHGGRRDPSMSLVAVHDYGVSFRLLRYRSAAGTKKDVTWERREHGTGAWIPGLGIGTTTSDLPLYREANAVQGLAVGEVVFVVESESSADALEAAGFYATTWAGGAASPQLDRLVGVLGDGTNVAVIADHDQVGLTCGRTILTALPAARCYFSPTPGEDARDIVTRDPKLGRLNRLDPPLGSVAYVNDPLDPDQRRIPSDDKRWFPDHCGTCLTAATVAVDAEDDGVTS